GGGEMPRRIQMRAVVGLAFDPLDRPALAVGQVRRLQAGKELRHFRRGFLVGLVGDLGRQPGRGGFDAALERPGDVDQLPWHCASPYSYWLIDNNAAAGGEPWRCAGSAYDVKPSHMSWSKHGRERGYHHGNLREALIRAALELIAEKGPAGFTFADAARWAGVSSAAPYRHFRDREALLADVSRRGFELFESALGQAWNDGRPDPYRAFENVGRAYLHFAR